MLIRKGFLKKIRYPISDISFWIRSLTWSMIFLVFTILLFLFFSKVEEVVVVRGKISPKGRVKEINFPGGGIVDELLVKEGDFVKKNQLLIKLDSKNIKQKVDSLYINLDIKQKQILALEENKKNLIKLYEEKIKKKENVLTIEKEISEKMNKLLNEGAIPKLMFLKQESKIVNLQSEIKQIKIQRNREIISEENEIEELKTIVSSYNAELIDSEINLNYKSIKSPLDGSIFDLQPIAKGIVLDAKKPIMKIVPMNQLEALINIPSEKIGFISKNMLVDISPDSYHPNDFGVIKGKLINIAKDSLPLQANNQYFYPAKVKLEQQFLTLKNGSKLPLKAGMTLQANIKLKKSSLLEIIFRGAYNKTNTLRKI